MVTTVYRTLQSCEHRGGWLALLQLGYPRPIPRQMEKLTNGQISPLRSEQRCLRWKHSLCRHYPYRTDKKFGPVRTLSSTGRQSNWLA